MHTVRSFGCRQILEPWFRPLFTSFWFRTRVFFSFLSIYDVAYLNCQPFLSVFNHFPYRLPLTLVMYNGQHLGRVDCLLKDRGSMSCTFCLCQTYDMTFTITPFSSSWAVLGIGRVAFFSQLSANSETPHQ